MREGSQLVWCGAIDHGGGGGAGVLGPRLATPGHPATTGTLGLSRLAEINRDLLPYQSTCLQGGFTGGLQNTGGLTSQVFD